MIVSVDLTYRCVDYRCTKCGEIKSSEEFGGDRGRRAAACKACKRNAWQTYRQMYPERVRASESKRASAHREYTKAWRSANAERVSSTRQAWMAANPDRLRAANRRWKQAHRERVKLSERAGTAVRRALRHGELTRPNQCEQCGSGRGRPEAAHADYARPLDVRWLCRRCHAKWDYVEPKTKIALAPEGVAS